MSESKSPNSYRKNKLQAFQPWQGNAEMLALAKELGLNVSEVINETLAENLQPKIKKKLEDIEKRLELVRNAKDGKFPEGMVRGRGFEPLTPTVSR